MTEVTTTDIPGDERTRIRLRVQLSAFVGLRLLAPIAVAVSTASIVDTLMYDGGPAALRLAILVVVGVLTAGAYTENLGTWEEEVEGRLVGRLRGGREWTCTTCGTLIRADWWTRETARHAHLLLSNPQAHGCVRWRRDLDA
ncbi:hypothetical protein [Streptomyces sp. H27-H5]|uniref:hypothetical protein n=1 Tax=Streptomyces sp. H27-H5 TaxID=2996460 RepID=UPI0022719D58|nr:hypothetical protein [Streptomyces sp. H27-H5]MCY0961480.1 hypothetical protein [Streptomyces sp. H27-H5]